jgi:hypothetical protein
MNVPLDQWSGADATKELHATLIRQHKEAKEQGKKLVFLTGLVLAVALLTLYFQIRPYHGDQPQAPSVAAQTP